MKANDPGAIAGLKYNADSAFLKEKIALTTKNKTLELGYYKDSEYLAEQRKNKLLQYEKDIFEYRQEIYEKSVFSAEEFNAKILGHIAENTKSISEIYADSINSIFDKSISQIDKLYDKIGIGKVPVIGDLAKGLSHNFLGNLTAGLFDSLGITSPQKTGNPQLDEAKTQTNYLKEIARNTSTAAQITNSFNVPNTPQGLDSLVSAVHELTHGGQGGGSGSGTNATGLNSPYTIKNFLGAGASGTRTGDVVGDISQVFAVDKGRGDFLSNIKFLFGKKDGAIFGKNSPIFGAQGFGNNVGTYGAIGGGAGLLGGLIGGRVGGFISGAGSGLALGAQIGSIIPGVGTVVGAAVGAIAGGLISLFGGDPKRKADKKQLPALNQGFTDAFTQFSQLIKDVKALRIEGESALAKGAELRSQVASGFGLTFQSKKYKKESDKLIQAKLAEIDKVPGGLFDQLRHAVDVANSANERQRRLIPEFASGNYFGRDDQMLDMRRGFIVGSQPGKDRHLGLFADGEAILNRQHQENLRRLAGFDILAHAGIPNYPRPPLPPLPNVKRYAEGNFFGRANSASSPANNQPPAPVIQNLNVQVELSVGKQFANEIIAAGADVRGGDGYRALTNAVKGMQEKRDVDFNKRIR